MNSFSFGSLFGTPVSDDQATLAAEAGRTAAEAAQASKGSVIAAEGFLAVMGRDDLMILPRLTRDLDDQIARDWQEGRTRKFRPSAAGAKSPLGDDRNLITARKR